MKLINFFKKSNKLEQKVYAVQTGFLIGNLLTIIEHNKDSKKYGVLACKMDELHPKALEVPEKDMEMGIEKGVLVYVETLRRGIFRDCKREYNILKGTK
jgi:hypothetical protein